MTLAWKPTQELLESCRGLPGVNDGPPGRAAVRRAHPELSDHKARTICEQLRAEWATLPSRQYADVPDKSRRFGVEESSCGLRVFSVDTEIRTVEEALAKGEVDLAIWEPYKTKVNSWPVAIRSDGQIETVWLWQVNVDCRRRVPAAIADACPALIERMKAHSPKYEKRPIRKLANPHLLELSLADHHFGKLAWSRETGEDWDLHIAEKVWINAVEDLLAKVNGYPIERILLPIGHDFFNYDTGRGETAKGTAQDNDSRPSKVFEIGVSSCVAAVDRCRAVAPVDIVWVPGNHDPTWSFHLVYVLSAWYRKDPIVNIDVTPRPRKYVSYGVNLLGLAHGDMAQQTLKQLPTVMAVEAPEQWAAALCREIHIGHWHTRKVVQTMPLMTFGGVTLRQLPSLTGTDAWHYSEGFVGNPKAADAYLWSKTDGLSGYFTTYADLQHQQT